MISILGFCGGFLLGIQLIPQLYKTYQTRSAEDISWFFMLMNIVGLTCMSIYGVLLSDPALYIPAFSSLLNTAVLCVMKYCYKPKNDLNDNI